VHSGASGKRNVDALFFMPGWDRFRFNKKCAGTCYAELGFLYPVGSAGHVGHPRASGVQHIDALFFMLGWDQYSFNKMCVVTCYAGLVFLHLMGSVGHIVHFGAFRV
jgi:hypothetical protein